VTKCQRPPLQNNVPHPYRDPGHREYNTTKEVQEMPARRDINLDQIYEMIAALQRDVALIKKCLIEEPELRADFVERMKAIDAEEAIIVEDFSKRYGLTDV